ncbi:hypothetical protein H0A70_08065 [Alcaligenaceae bacterium]|nr:hypothetical protein [Alcaligenaceae bacterium]
MRKLETTKTRDMILPAIPAELMEEEWGETCKSPVRRANRRKSPFPVRAWRKTADAKELRYSQDPYGWGLPFSEVKNNGAERHWVVPAKGGYAGGCKVGEAMAFAYMKQLRSPQGCGAIGLQHIVMSLMARVDQAGGAQCFDQRLGDCPAEIVALHGQIVGFFGALGGYLAWLAKNSLTGLDGLTEEDILASANSYIGGGAA